jgi:C1A family cysteine protease
MFALIILFAGGLAQASDGCESFDLRHYWPKGSIRNQGDAGSCHVFAAVALAEASLRYQNGTYIDLSEQDLFERHLVANEKKVKVIDQLLGNKSIDPYTGEGGLTLKTLNFLQSQGAAWESSKPYELNDSQKSYSKLLGMLRRDRDQIQKSVQESCGGKTVLFSLEPAVAYAAESVVWKEIKRRAQEQSPSMQNEARAVQAWTKNWSFTTLESEFPTDRQKIKQEWLTLLKKGYPFVASVQGYDKIVQGKPVVDTDGYHAVVVAGYDCRTKEFIIRNSWGGAYAKPEDDGYERIASHALAKHTRMSTWIQENLESPRR